jgi:hypothetical protein
MARKPGAIAPAFALRFEAREHPHNTDEMLAAIAAKRLRGRLNET